MKKLFSLIIIAFLISCSSNKTEENSKTIQENVSEKNSVLFTQEQIEIAGIKTGHIEKQKISEIIECTGSIDVPPGNIASVSPIIEGFVKTLNYFPGDFVEKGAVLATLQHPLFIQLQQQYLEAKSQAEYYQEEFKRQGELTVENAASIKKMQKAKADFLTSEANYKSFKAQLELLGVNPTKIENDDFEKEFKIIAPISGTISQLNTNKGRLVNPENPVYEIINDEYLFLNINVFEKDITKVSSGQKITFQLLNDPKEYISKVKRIGIGIDKVNRTTMVQSITEKKSYKLKPGKFINASIHINEREVFTLPSESIVDYNGELYLFLKTDTIFNLVKIKTGIEQNNFYEILGPETKLLKADIVTRGTYYLLSKLEAEE
ncbi:efflux RND transporter periplasmic adaptor subunit [Bacteroidota bacterium]